VDGKAGHLLALAQDLTDELLEAVKFGQALRVPPLSRAGQLSASSPDEVVNGGLKRVVEVKSTLSEFFGSQGMFVGERNMDSKPLAQGLKLSASLAMS